MLKNFLTRLSSRIGRSIRVVIGLILILCGVTLAALFGWCRVYVPPGMCVVRIAKFGALPSADKKVVDPGEKGIQRETWGPGRYFLNPISWDTELHPLVEIKPGDPGTWKWVHTTSRLKTAAGPDGNIITGEFPQIGILTRKTGAPAPSDEPVPMKSAYKGIIREVLPPGVYRINPYEYSCEIRQAMVIPTGFVGVVTNQTGRQPDLVPDTVTEEPASQPDSTPPPVKKVRPLARGDERGTLADVLPPGVYYVNPYLQRVKITEVGFNEFSQLAGSTAHDTIRFPSKSGYDIELGVTVVWGLHPRHAAQVINEFGNTHEVLEKVIKPQLRSICRNQGSLYEARDFIQGDKREEFQHVLTTTLHDVCARKNIELLLALISSIEVRSQEGDHPAGETDLRTEIQESFVAVERQLTNVKLQDTAKIKASLEEARKKVDVARETIQAQTRMKVATTMADGERKAAEIAARGKLRVAEIEQQIAEIESQKTALLGKAKADIEKLKFQAQAEGKRLLVDALGSGEAYNMYTFAKNFSPESIRLIFAGPGTFWTDLTKFEELGGAQMLKQSSAPKPAP